MMSQVETRKPSKNPREDANCRQRKVQVIDENEDGMTVTHPTESRGFI